MLSTANYIFYQQLNVQIYAVSAGDLQPRSLSPAVDVISITSTSSGGHVCMIGRVILTVSN